MAQHTLVCPFLNDDPVFAYGVEFGMLYARMNGESPEIADYFCLENQEQILLLASRLGWHIRETEQYGRDWFWCVMERKSPWQSGCQGHE
jgi:hypothetical protein